MQIKQVFNFCKNGNYHKVVRYLEQFTDHVNIRYGSNEDTLLSVACRYGHLNLVNFLLDQPRIDINARNKSETTPLFSACYHGHAHVVQRLMLDPRVNVNVENNCQLTPFLLACYYGHLSIVESLIKHPHLDTKKLCVQGMTAFHIAALKGQQHVVQFLIENLDIDLNEKDQFDRTALYLACTRNQIKVVELLIKNPRVNTNAKGWCFSEKKYSTPLEISKQKNFTEIVTLIKEVHQQRVAPSTGSSSVSTGTKRQRSSVEETSRKRRQDDPTPVMPTGQPASTSAEQGNKKPKRISIQSLLN